MPDCRDLALKYFSAVEQELLERLASVEDDCETYRALAQQAIHQLHDVTRSREQLREQHERLRDEYRHLREQILTNAWPAA